MNHHSEDGNYQSATVPRMSKTSKAKTISDSDVKVVSVAVGGARVVM